MEFKLLTVVMIIVKKFKDGFVKNIKQIIRHQFVVLFVGIVKLMARKLVMMAILLMVMDVMINAKSNSVGTVCLQLVLVQSVHLIVVMGEELELNLAKEDVMMQMIYQVMVAIIVKLSHIISVQ